MRTKFDERWILTLILCLFVTSTDAAPNQVELVAEFGKGGITHNSLIYSACVSDCGEYVAYSDGH
jgi:hypothetical protein